MPQDVQKQLVNGIPQAIQVIIPGAGHAASVDSPQALIELWLVFSPDKPVCDLSYRRP